jgi:hypothetical protein
MSQELAAAIGHAVIEWGRVEDTAGALTAILLQADMTDFRAVHANMMGAGKFDTLSAVALRRLPPRQAATIVKICVAVKGQQAERNRIVHGCWFRGRIPTVGVRYSYRAYGVLDPKREEVSAARIAGHTAEVARLGRRLNYALERQGIYRREPRA